MKFNLEQLLIFWKLRDIIATMNGHSYIQLKTNKSTIGIWYTKEHEIYSLHMVNKLARDEFGTVIKEFFDEDALNEVNNI